MLWKLGAEIFWSEFEGGYRFASNGNNMCLPCIGRQLGYGSMVAVVLYVTSCRGEEAEQ